MSHERKKNVHLDILCNVNVGNEHVIAEKLSQINT